jgi:hypothetical protein
MRELGFQKSQIALLKFPGQPRVPAGSGRPSGEYSSGQQGDVATVTPVAYHEPRQSQPRNENSSSHTLSSEPTASASVTPASAPLRADSALCLLNPVSTAEAAEVSRSNVEIRAKIAELALSQVGSEDWTEDASRGDFGSGSNKCNLFRAYPVNTYTY